MYAPVTFRRRVGEIARLLGKLIAKLGAGLWSKQHPEPRAKNSAREQAHYEAPATTPFVLETIVTVCHVRLLEIRWLSERRCLMRAGKMAGSATGVIQRVVQETPSLVRNGDCPTNRTAEAGQLSSEVIEDWLERPPHATPMFREEEIPGYPPDDRSSDRCNNSS